MDFRAEDELSYIIRVNGEIVPVMPDDEEFSLQEIRDYVAGVPEVACKTPDGFLLFRNKDGEANGLAHNSIASLLYRKSAQQKDSVLGRVFLAHPNHVAPYWKAGKASALNLRIGPMNLKLILRRWPEVLLALSLVGLVYLWLHGKL